MLRVPFGCLEKQGDDRIIYEDVLEAAATNITIDEGWPDLQDIWHSPLGLLVPKKVIL